jgi:ABC-type multidrug transport system permease subunit
MNLVDAGWTKYKLIWMLGIVFFILEPIVNNLFIPNLLIIKSLDFTTRFWIISMGAGFPYTIVLFILSIICFSIGTIGMVGD